MRELKDILALHEARMAAGEDVVLATVMRARGSTYRRPGARMLMTKDTRLAGAVSGGCLEGDVLRKGWWRTSGGAATLLTYDATTDDDEDLPWGFGLGCNGAIDVLVERLVPGDPGDPLTFLRESIRCRRRAVVVTVLRGAGDIRPGARLLLEEANDAGGARAPVSNVEDAALRDAMLALARQAMAQGMSCDATLPWPLSPTPHATRDAGADDAAATSGLLDLRLELVSPPQTLFLFGNGYDALPVVKLASELGWDVTVVESRASTASTRDFPGARAMVRCAPDRIQDALDLDPSSAAVIMSHRYEVDRAVLAALLPRTLRYLGVLGPRRRTDRLLADLERAKVACSPSHAARIHAPVGLDLGASSPEEIALAIVAEVQRVVTRTTGLSLSGSARREPHGSQAARGASEAVTRAPRVDADRPARIDA